MAAQIDMKTARVLLSLGWTLNKHHTAAYREEAGMRASVWSDGRWAVTAGRLGAILASGEPGQHPAAAAMDANEALWSRRPVAG